MPRPTQGSIALEGMLEAQLALKRFMPTPEERKAMNESIVDEVLVPPSKVEAPRRSGNLADSIRADASPTYGFILAGYRTGKVIYGSVIHYGWATRGLGRKEVGNLGPKERRRILLEAWEKDVAGKHGKTPLGKSTVEKAARKARPQYRKRAIRGGPIPPNPFIYRTVDRRHDEVWAAYNSQLEARARIEDLL